MEKERTDQVDLELLKGQRRELWNHRIMESCGLEKTSEIIRSNHQPSTTPIFHSKPHQVPHPHEF